MNDIVTPKERITFPSKWNRIINDCLWMIVCVGMFIYYVYELTK